jgi:hypothetical protein
VNTPGRILLLLAAGCSAVVALLHVAILLVGPPWYRWFGASSLAQQIESGSALGPTLLTLAVAALFVVWTGYGLSGAGVIRRLPLLRVGLYVIAAIYVLRGVQVLLEVPAAVHGRMPARFAVFSAFSALAGAAYLVGALRSGRSGRPPSTHAARSQL